MVDDSRRWRYEHIQVEIDAPIATITLNRPKVLNALSPELVREVNEALVELDADERVRAVVLTGGPRVFAAGADIGDMADRTAVEQLRRDQTGRWAGIAAFGKPLIAAVNGYALGGGCELALMCDLIIAGDIGPPRPARDEPGHHPRRGRHPALAAHRGQVRRHGGHAHRRADHRPARARAGNRQQGRAGRDDHRGRQERSARQLAEKPPLAARMAKEAVLKAFESPLTEGLSAERKSFYFLFSTEDQKEGMHAFLEKRRGVFKGK